MSNSTFQADAIKGFSETPARGPFTLAMSNTAIYVSLPNITANYTMIIDKIKKQISDGTAVNYLPADYNSDPTLIAGYKHQLAVLAETFADPKAPVLESPFGGASLGASFLLKPLSRGTVRLDPRNHLEKPILDYRTASNPIDFDLHIANVRYLRRAVQTETSKKYGGVESSPGVSAQTDDDIIQFVKRSMTMSFMHPCCTAAMMPKEKGGVTGPDLKVHGASGLRVADISIVPLIPGTHTSATAYAIGEKVRLEIIFTRYLNIAQ
jgi:choline dehydrogenase